MIEETTHVEGLNVRYQVEGAGPDILFLHGWASSRRMWAQLVASLSAEFRCWSVDLPGCGDSDKPANGWYAIPKYTAIVASFLKRMGLAAAHVVGHSMGGMIAFDLAAQHPARVQRLVAINPVVTGRRASLRPLAHWGPGRRLLNLTLRLTPFVFQPVLSHPLGEGLYAGLQHIRRRTEDFARGTVDSIWGSGQAVINYDVSSRLAGIGAPTLVILGHQDLTVSNAEGRLAAARIRGARLVELSAGHLVTDDRPAEVLRTLRDFLA